MEKFYSHICDWHKKIYPVLKITKETKTMLYSVTDENGDGIKMIVTVPFAKMLFGQPKYLYNSYVSQLETAEMINVVSQT